MVWVTLLENDDEAFWNLQKTDFNYRYCYGGGICWCFLFMEDILFRTLFISFVFVFLCGLLFLLDLLHNRYNDNLLEEITLLIETLVEQQERTGFSEAEDTLTARLQHQLLKLRNILKAQNQMLTQEKEQIKTLISDISHQIKTPVAAANTFAQLLGDTGLSD